MNWWCYNAHSFELSTTRVQHYLEIFLFRSNSRWEGNFCYIWYKRSRGVFSWIFLSVLKNGFIKCPYLWDFLYEKKKKKKQIYSQNGHKLNHMFQKLLFHMFKSYFSASSTMFSDSNYKILNQSVSSIAIEVLRPMPSEQPPFNTGRVRQFFPPFTSLSFVHFYKHFGSGENFDGAFDFGEFPFKFGFSCLHSQCVHSYRECV